jgi:hypothetical protein
LGKGEEFEEKFLGFDEAAGFGKVQECLEIAYESFQGKTLAQKVHKKL